MKSKKKKIVKLLGEIAEHLQGRCWQGYNPKCKGKKWVNWTMLTTSRVREAAENIRIQ